MTNFGQQPANDDRETIGDILQTIQKGRPRRSAYTIATLFSGLWIAGVGFLAFAFMPALEAIVGQGSGGILALVGLLAVIVAPLVLFYALASLAWRSQEMSLIAQSMAQMAVPLLRAGACRQWLNRDRGSGHPPRSRGDGRWRRARHRACRRTRGARRQ